MYSYNPTHYTANGAGKVLEHVYVMSKHIGRPLKNDECVHHKDRDKTNNKLYNLQLMTLSEHVMLHMREDKGYVSESRACKKCGMDFDCSNTSKQVFCSSKCFREDSRRFEITEEELYRLVWEYPTTEVAKLLGVSDVAVSKRCKSLGIDKPSRGYWSKVRSSIQSKKKINPDSIADNATAS